MDSQSPGSTADPAPVRSIPWLQATEDDLTGLDFEAPIVGSLSATCNKVSEIDRRAAQPPRPGAPDTAETRVLAMFSAFTGMHLRAKEREEPFSPSMPLADAKGWGSQKAENT
jgi:hypothetical protein